MYSYCNVFSKLIQICSSGFDESSYSVSHQLAVQKSCVASYLSENTAVTVAQFDVYVSLEGWDSVQALLNDPAGLRALEATVMSTVPNVVGVDSSVVGNNETRKAMELDLIHRSLSTNNSISVKLTIQIVPPKSVPAVTPEDSVATAVAQLNQVISTPQFTDTLNSLRTVSPDSWVVNSTNSLSGLINTNDITMVNATSIAPVTNIPIQVIPPPVYIVLLSTTSPTHAPTSPPPVLADNIYSYLVKAIGFVPLVIVLILTACLLLTCITYIRRTYTVYTKHQEPVDLKILDKLFPPTADDGDSMMDGGKME